MTQTIESIQLERIAATAETQMRARLDPDTIARYAASYDAGEKLPPLVVFGPDENGIYTLADGFQRREAAQQCGVKKLQCDIRKGSLRDAILFAAGANSTHGLPRTDADKRRSVVSLLNDKEWSKNGADWMCKQCHVAKTFVLTIKRDLAETRGEKVKTKPERKGAAKGGRPRKDGSKAGTPATRSLPATAASKKGLDDYSRPIPKDLMDAFADGDSGNLIVHSLGDIMKEVAILAGTPGGSLLAKNKIESELKTVREGIAKVMPSAVCPACDGTGSEGAQEDKKACQHCNGRGWVNSIEFHALPNRLCKLCNDAKAAAGKE